MEIRPDPDIKVHRACAARVVGAELEPRPTPPCPMISRYVRKERWVRVKTFSMRRVNLHFAAALDPQLLAITEGNVPIALNAHFITTPDPPCVRVLLPG